MGDLNQALDTAMEMEKRGYELYRKAAAKTRNKFGQITLEAIAEKELDHMKAIEEFAAQNLHLAIESIQAKEKSDYIRRIMAKLAGQLEKKTSDDADLRNAYEVAMKLEKESYALYQKLGGEATDSVAKQFFSFLMKEESNHYDLLSETLQYLDRPGDWFREKERWLVEGG